MDMIEEDAGTGRFKLGKNKNMEIFTVDVMGYDQATWLFYSVLKWNLQILKKHGGYNGI